MSSYGWVVAPPLGRREPQVRAPWHHGAMGPSTSWDQWPRPVTRAVVGTQECTQIDQNGLSAPFQGVCVHCCAVGLDCGWPWDRNSVHKWEDRASPRRIGAFVYTVGLLRRCGQARGRRSVHRLTKVAPRSRFGAFVYTVATRALRRELRRVARAPQPPWRAGVQTFESYLAFGTIGKANKSRRRLCEWGNR